MISWNTIFEDFHFFGQNEDIWSPTFLEAHRQEVFFLVQIQYILN